MENMNKKAKVKVELSRKDAKYSHTSKMVVEGEELEVEVWTM